MVFVIAFAVNDCGFEAIIFQLGVLEQSKQGSPEYNFP